MKIFFFVIFFCFFSFNSQAINIAIFQYSLIFYNSIQYKEFQKKLNTIKKKIFNNLKKDEEKLLKKKKEIEDSKVILTKSEFEKKTLEYNIETNKFESNVDKVNNYIQSNIEFNENIILNEIVQIVEKISIEKKIDLVFNENQYFISSEDINISNIIIQKLNKTKLELNLSDFE